jgi:cysteinyl-tRNA synthetase
MALPVIRIHDTLSRKKVELRPLEDDHVRMYACGPTVYGFIHLGNGRMFIAFDLVARHLRARGYKVTYARNITDIDDKIIKRAAELGEEPAQLAQRFTDEFHKDVGAVGCQPPDLEPRVTGTMPAILEMIETLIKKGLAYESGGDVYFAVQQFPPYGELSQKPIDELQAGARVEVSDKKRDPLDFALWKAAKPGEPSWASPWGAGRPGWHIECSAMTWKYLGAEFDIHGGGVDLQFPHHENERAQSLGALGTFARIWMHNGFINFGGGKISKSDESTRVLFERAFKLRVLVERHGGEPIRYFCLTTQYRNPISFEVMVEGDDAATAPLRFPGLEEAEKRLEYGYLTLQRLRDQLAVGKPAGDGALAPEAEARRRGCRGCSRRWTTTSTAPRRWRRWAKRWRWPTASSTENWTRPRTSSAARWSGWRAIWRWRRASSGCMRRSRRRGWPRTARAAAPPRRSIRRRWKGASPSVPPRARRKISRAPTRFARRWPPTASRLWTRRAAPPGASPTDRYSW